MNSAVPALAVVTTVRPLTDDTTLFTLRTKAYLPAAATFLPGQFLELSLPGVGEIPVSYCGFPSTDGSIELCIRHIGHVTKPLQSSVPGDVVGLRGPFGKGFPLSSYNDQDLLLIAGGLGMAPLRSLLLALMKQQDQSRRIKVLYGCREPGAQLFVNELLELQKQGAIDLQLAVDRPGHCLTGPPDCRVALLPALLAGLAFNPLRTYAAICGPPVVYPLLVENLQQSGLAPNRIHLSLERRMQCGVGRCGHCAIGQLLCCVDGPVFSVAELDGIKGALS